MKRSKKLLGVVFTVLIVFCLFATPAAAITEGDVQGQVNSQGREAVAGNVFVWFLCAIGFLKISQKIDSFMSSLGINVGHTGGSMLAEAVIAARGVSIGKQALGAGSGARRGGGAPGAEAAAGFMSGGLAGVVGRQVSKGAMKAATGQGGGGIGGRVFQSSVNRGGDFANNVISTVARGNVSNNATMTGPRASMALSSYMGHAGQADAPAFSNVEIGGGHITGTETSAAYPGGTAFGMYSAERYAAPEGSYDTVHAVDGSKWYKQYAAASVEQSPYMASDGSVAYKESIVQNLPRAPKRKDRT